MDEILIGEKKYVSSKQAAKVTGYAKDYIGQLCREGRVPARLVGRSWYVLETAIHDHRFGDQKTEQETQVESPVSTFPSTWESPRYEASPADTLPSVNRLRDTAEESIYDRNEASQHLQDSWRAWFDRVEDTESADKTQNKAMEIDEEKSKTEGEEVNVPVHPVYRQPPEELLPRRMTVQSPNKEEEQYYDDQKAPQRGKEKRRVIVQVTGALFAVLAATFAMLGSGYFDEYVISNSQVSLMAGVSLYNK